MKTKYLLAALVLTSCNSSQDLDVSYLQGAWNCKTVFKYDGGYILEVSDVTEANASSMTYTKSANISSYYIDKPEQRSVLHYKSKCSFSVDNNYMTTDCQPVMTRIDKDDLSIYTPKFIDGFKSSFKPKKSRIIKVSDKVVKFEEVETKNIMACEKI